MSALPSLQTAVSLCNAAQVVPVKNWKKAAQSGGCRGAAGRAGADLEGVQQDEGLFHMCAHILQGPCRQFLAIAGQAPVNQQERAALVCKKALDSRAAQGAAAGERLAKLEADLEAVQLGEALPRQLSFVPTAAFCRQHTGSCEPSDIRTRQHARSGLQGGARPS